MGSPSIAIAGEARVSDRHLASIHLTLLIQIPRLIGLPGLLLKAHLSSHEENLLQVVDEGGLELELLLGHTVLRNDLPLLLLHHEDDAACEAATHGFLREDRLEPISGGRAEQ